MEQGRLKALEREYVDARAAGRRKSLLLLAVVALIFAISGIQAEVDIAKFAEHLGNFTSYLGRIALLENGQPVVTDPGEWFWGWRGWSAELAETLLMAYVGTLTGTIGGFLLCFLAAANLTSMNTIRFIVRRYLEFCRTVPDLVFALIFVSAFGLGPVPGVMAIAIHTTGALGKLFAEVVENINMNPVEGMIATGSTRIQQIRFAVLPQVVSNFASYSLLRFEINVRSAAVIGFVGAGGIGQELLTSIRRFQYSDVSALLVMIIATVIVIDLATERLRHSLLSPERT